MPFVSLTVLASTADVDPVSDTNWMLTWFSGFRLCLSRTRPAIVCDETADESAVDNATIATSIDLISSPVRDARIDQVDRRRKHRLEHEVEELPRDQQP